MGLFMPCWSVPIPADVKRLVPRVKLAVLPRINEYIAALRAQPPGQRCIMPWAWMAWQFQGDVKVGTLCRHPDDRARDKDGNLRPCDLDRNQILWYPDATVGIVQVKGVMQQFIDAFVRARIEIDYCLCDHEGPSFGYWGNHNPDWKMAIDQDPRWKGLTSYDADDLPTLSTIPRPVVGPDGFARSPQPYQTFHAIGQRLTDKAINAAIYEPLKAAYPNIQCSNWWTGRRRRDLMEQYRVPHGAHWQWSESDGVGTHCNVGSYGGVDPVLARQPWRKDGALVGDTPWSSMLAMIKRVELSEDSSPKPMMVEVAPKAWTAVARWRDYIDDFTRHLFVRGILPLLFNAHTWMDDASNRASDALVADCEAQGLDKARQIHWHHTEWADTVVWSTCRVGDKQVHRITLEDPADGVQVRIGRAVKTLKPEPGQFGLWLTHDASEHFEIVTGANRPVIHKPAADKVRTHLGDINS
jgi:hypothetical protein